MCTWISPTRTHGSTNYNINVYMYININYILALEQIAALYMKTIWKYNNRTVWYSIIYIHVHVVQYRTIWKYNTVECRTICKNMPASCINIYCTSIQQKGEYQKWFMIFCLKQLSGYLTVNRYPDSKRQD